MNEHLRQTGRTTRLMKKAQDLVAMGHTVTLLVHDDRYRRTVAQRAEQLRYSFRVSVVPQYFDWEKMRPREVRDSTTVWLADHAAVEQHLQHLDEEILRLQQLARQLYALTT